MKNELLNITGMTCDGCTSNVAHALKAVNGVHDVVVSLNDHEASVRYDEHIATHEQLTSAVQSAGYGLGTGSGNSTQKPQGKGGCCS